MHSGGDPSGVRRPAPNNRAWFPNHALLGGALAVISPIQAFSSAGEEK